MTSNSEGAYSLRVLDAPTKAASTVTVDAPATAPRAKQLTVKGKVASKVAVPAGTRLTVTRTDLESPKGKAPGGGGHQGRRHVLLHRHPAGRRQGEVHGGLRR